MPKTTTDMLNMLAFIIETGDFAGNQDDIITLDHLSVNKDTMILTLVDGEGFPKTFKIAEI